MRAITLWQPWASAVALKLKLIETRSWGTKYRGPLAIHAAKRPLDLEEDLLLMGTGLHGYPFPFGAVVATCNLVACEPTAYLRPSVDEAYWGNFTPGRWGWVFENVQPFAVPIPARGFQQIWDWDPPASAERGGES